MTKGGRRKENIQQRITRKVYSETTIQMGK